MLLQNVIRLLPLLLLIAETTGVEVVVKEHDLSNTIESPKEGEALGCECATVGIISSSSKGEGNGEKVQADLSPELKNEIKLYKCDRCQQFFHPQCIKNKYITICPGKVLGSMSCSHQPKRTGRGATAFIVGGSLTLTQESKHLRAKVLAGSVLRGRILLEHFRLVETTPDWLKKEWIYRTAGDSGMVKKIVELLKLEGQQAIYMKPITDPITITCKDSNGNPIVNLIEFDALCDTSKALLKDPPIVDSAEFQLMIQWYNIQYFKTKPDATHELLTKAFNSMRRRNLADLQLLLLVLAHVQTIASHSERNKMTLANLVLMFGPNLFEDNSEPEAVLLSINDMNRVFGLLTKITDDLLVPERWKNDELRLVMELRQ